MIVKLPPKTLKLFGIVLIIAAFVTDSMAQGSSPNKGSSNPDTVEIINDTFFPLSHIVEKAVPDEFSYTNVSIRLSLKGKTPANDLPITLIMNGYGPKKPQFYNGLSASDTCSIKIDKADFKANGGENIISKEFMIRFSRITDDSGDGYIQIQGRNDPTKYYHLSFSPPNSDNKASTTFTGSKITHSKPTKPGVRPGITLVDAVDTIQLDSFKTNTAQQVTVTLSLKLNQGSWKNDTVGIIVKALTSSQDIKILDVNDIPPIPVDSDEWDTTKDVIVKKIVSFFVQQTKSVTDLQTIKVYLKGQKERYVIQLAPFKSKTKPSTLKLVLPGKAEIISAKKIGITHEYASELNNIDTITVKVKLHGYNPGHNQLVFMLVDSLDTSISKHFKILENPVTIIQSDWQSVPKTILPAPVNDTTGILYIHLHIKTIGINDSLNNLEFVDIVLKGQSQVNKGTQRVNISIKDVPFWAEAGTNFALLDNIKTNNFYAGVYGFAKDIGRVGWFNRNEEAEKNYNLSGIGGVYESQSVGSSSTSAAGIVYRDIKTVYRDTGVVSATTSVKSIGILFSPFLKLTNGKTDANGLHLFFSFYTELLWQTITSTFNYQAAKLAADTLNSLNLSQYPFKEASISYDFRSHYQGFGLPFYLKENIFTLFVNDVFGVTNQRYYVNNATNFSDIVAVNPKNPYPNYISDLTFLTPKSKWNFFLLFQYRLTDVAYGITFSGEIREILVSNAKPVVTLAISKKLDISKLFNSVLAADK